jgi:hypothetical protein
VSLVDDVVVELFKCEAFTTSPSEDRGFAWRLLIAESCRQGGDCCTGLV